MTILPELHLGKPFILWLYLAGEAVGEKSYLCTDVIMMTIMDGPYVIVIGNVSYITHFRHYKVIKVTYCP